MKFIYLYSFFNTKYLSSNKDNLSSFSGINSGKTSNVLLGYFPNELSLSKSL
jgi:hypothetical protein